ncbi:TPA: IS1595 family transposase [Patescibacteria group bacterium]|nr:MAG: ISSpo3, transposase [Parcubacteria group bacterium GW2011_GWD2_42_14]HCC04697.1 IS1595 family transposase [Patescibacteria group bacterium]
MAQIDKYSIRDLKADFPDDDTALAFIFDALHSHQCSCGGVYKKVSNRRKYQCSKCRFQIAPTAGTIFHKSDTPLNLWFHAIWVFSNAKSGVSAKELERQLGVTYKTAWRMLKLIREALGVHGGMLRGDVETDLGYFGGIKSAGANNVNLSESIAHKSPVMVAIERGGTMIAEVVTDGTTKTHTSFVERNIEKGSRLLTDKSNKYHSVAKGYDRFSVNHSKGEYAWCGIHINHVESFFAHVKRSMKGTYKVVSKKYLQLYLNQFAWLYNNRHNDRARFGALLGTVLLGVR